MNKEDLNEYDKYANALFEIKKYLLDRLNEYENCVNKKHLSHIAFKILILNLLGKIDKVEILEKKIPEKIEYYDDSIAWVIDDVGQLSDVDKVIIDTLNGVIDYLKSKGE